MPLGVTCVLVLRALHAVTVCLGRQAWEVPLAGCAHACRLPHEPPPGISSEVAVVMVLPADLGHHVNPLSPCRMDASGTDLPGRGLRCVGVSWVVTWARALLQDAILWVGGSCGDQCQEESWGTWEQPS